MAGSGARFSLLPPENAVGNYVERLAAATQALTPQSGSVLAQMQAHGLIFNTLQTQASLWAFVENFGLFGLLCLCCLPLILLFKKVSKKTARPGMH